MAQSFMSKGAVIEMAVTYFPSFLRSRKQAQTMGAWMNGEQYRYSEDNLDVDDPAFGQAFAPNNRDVTREYENLRGLSPNNFAGLIINTLSQLTYLEGISRPGVQGVLPAYQTFLRNRWNSKQSAIHRGALGQAVAYGVVLPGDDPLTGSKMSKMYGKSAVDMCAFYDGDDDEWPTLAIEAYERFEDIGLGQVIKAGWTVRIYDAEVIHYLVCDGDGGEKKDWKYVSYDEHKLPVPPVARCANRVDLEGRARGVIEPVLPLLRRIDQDTFDRLMNQRFGTWQIRYIAGMAKPTSADAQRAQAFKLRIEDLLVSTDKDTKFGVLPGAPIEPQIAATDHDLRLLSAIAQMPPHHLLGLSSNLQAEALAAATEGLQRQAFEFRTNAGEFHEQMARLVAMAEGDLVTAAAWDLRVRWKDTESGSMSQAADALGKLAAQLGVPFEMLWERIPGWTDTDVQRAKELVESGGIQKLIEELLNQTGQPQPAGAPSQGGTGGSNTQ